MLVIELYCYFLFPNVGLLSIAIPHRYLFPEIL